MAAYFLFEIDITDPSWGAEYGEKVGPLVAKHGGKLLVRSTDPVRAEGSRGLPTVVVVLEFPTREAAEAWHGDPEYKPLIDLRNSGSTAECLLVDGV
ncbi:MAG: DUF1330 domain-containing protein [Rhodospirillaceae bacterium]|jgi:uncharacterized protein (DUF1330 family)|nr:DUF1330 domain-containing protein [Rhodospirillaceae bacterium]MBT5667695.1 DUF1330 domain-containing protein [Rhodospirillaceae bacterium]MBT5808861.1 DUF1330 domain-containing protein [Rhodospirillaceae bacterium]